MKLKLLLMVGRNNSNRNGVVSAQVKLAFLVVNGVFKSALRRKGKMNFTLNKVSGKYLCIDSGHDS